MNEWRERERERESDGKEQRKRRHSGNFCGRDESSSRHVTSRHVMSAEMSTSSNTIFGLLFYETSLNNNNNNNKYIIKRRDVEDAPPPPLLLLLLLLLCLLLVCSFFYRIADNAFRFSLYTLAKWGHIWVSIGQCVLGKVAPCIHVSTKSHSQGHAYKSIRPKVLDINAISRSLLGGRWRSLI